MITNILPDGMTTRLPTLKEFMKPYRKEWNENTDLHKVQTQESYEYELECYYYETIGRGLMKTFGKELTARRDNK